MPSILPTLLTGGLLSLFLACSGTQEEAPSPEASPEIPASTPERPAHSDAHPMADAPRYHSDTTPETEEKPALSDAQTPALPLVPFEEEELSALLDQLKGEWTIQYVIANDENGEFEVGVRDEYWNETRETWRIRPDGTFHHLFDANLSFSGKWEITHRVAASDAHSLPSDCCFVFKTTEVRVSYPMEMRPVEYHLGRFRPELDLVAFHYLGDSLNNFEGLQNGRGFRRKVPR